MRHPKTYVLSLTEVRRKGRYEERLPVPDEDLSPECREIISGLEAAVDVSYVGEEKFYWQARMSGTALQVCARCLEPLRLPWEHRFAVMLAPPGGAEQADEVAYSPDLEFMFLTLLEEEVTLSQPMKPLCSEGCRGLCPVCGINRNRESCHCEARPKDPRLAALTEIRGKLKPQ